MSLSDGLIAAYTMNDVLTGLVGSEPALEDVSGVSFFTGHIGKAVGTGGNQGSGAGSYLRATSELFDLEGVSRTFAGWYRAESYAGNPGIISNWANGAGPVQWLLWFDGSKITWQARDAADADHAATEPSAAIQSAWAFYSCTYNHVSGDLTLRINNLARVTANTPSIKSGTTVFEIGNRNGNGAVLNGGHDLFLAYNRVLSLDEELALYNAGMGIEPPYSDENDDLGPADNFRRRMR